MFITFTKLGRVKNISVITSDSSMFLVLNMYFSSWISFNRLSIFHQWTSSGRLIYRSYFIHLCCTHQVIRISIFQSSYHESQCHVIHKLFFIRFKRPNMSWPIKSLARTWLWIPYLIITFQPIPIDTDLNKNGHFTLLLQVT